MLPKRQCQACAPSRPPPQRIRELYATSSFQKRIRGYNSAFACTSTGHKEDYSNNRGGDPYTFRINGSMLHRIGQFLSMEGATPAFAHIYVYDDNLEQEQSVRQMGISTGLDERIVGELQSILYEINPLAKVYKSARKLWCLQTTYVGGVRRNNNTQVSIREHKAHRLYFKHPSIEFSLVHRAGRLCKQWCVDMAANL
ncbi:ATP-dependent DNA helicase [Phytophthora megakarya]|uniref:ATP-dependent DNA helicase n=1 Tax=Phytophthora megakarya TaxID=4795 RepID=A0A225V9Q9_9STRA|nr:ATP-dependent DNA helicase [Phytophthora megakarya]